jgi:hypothetical protein
MVCERWMLSPELERDASIRIAILASDNHTLTDSVSGGLVRRAAAEQRQET